MTEATITGGVILAPVTVFEVAGARYATTVDMTRWESGDPAWLASLGESDETPYLLESDRDLVQMPNGDVVTWEDYYLSTLDDRYNPEED